MRSHEEIKSFMEQIAEGVMSNTLERKRHAEEMLPQLLEVGRKNNIPLSPLIRVLSDVISEIGAPVADETHVMTAVATLCWVLDLPGGKGKGGDELYRRCLETINNPEYRQGVKNLSEIEAKLKSISSFSSEMYDLISKIKETGGSVHHVNLDDSPLRMELPDGIDPNNIDAVGEWITSKIASLLSRKQVNPAKIEPSQN